MDAASARHLAETGMLFIPAETRTTNKRPDVQGIHREMAEALGAPPAHVPVPTVVTAPSDTFDQVFNALFNGVWSDNLRTNYTCMHKDGKIEFVQKS